MKFDLSNTDALPGHVKIAFDAMASAVKAKDWTSALAFFKAIARVNQPAPGSSKPIVAWMHPTANLVNAEQWVYGPNSRGLVFADPAQAATDKACANSHVSLKAGTTAAAKSPVYVLAQKQLDNLLDYATLGSVVTTKLMLDSLNSLKPLDVFSDEDMDGATYDEMKFGLSIARNEVDRIRLEANAGANPAPANGPNNPLTLDLAALVKRMAVSLQQARPANALAHSAMDFLKRNKLTGQPLRAQADLSTTTAKVDALAALPGARS